MRELFFREAFMQEKNFLMESVIIRQRDYGENDRIITILGMEHGKIPAIAKGVRKQSSNLRGPTTLFAHSRLALYRGRGNLFTVTQGETLNPFLSLREDLTKIVYASYVAELLDVGLPEGKPHDDVFLLALATFSLFDLHGDLPLAARFFELRFLRQLGLAPDLEGCRVCGRRLFSSTFTLSPLHGGLLCAACHGKAAGLVSAGTAQVMRQLLNMDLHKLPSLKLSRQNHQEMREAVIPYLDYHLDYSAKARVFLDSLGET